MVHGLDTVCMRQDNHSSPGFSTPCSARPATTSPTPLALQMPEIGTGIGAISGRQGTFALFATHAEHRVYMKLTKTILPFRHAVRETLANLVRLRYRL